MEGNNILGGRGGGGHGGGGGGHGGGGGLCYSKHGSSVCICRHSQTLADTHLTVAQFTNHSSNPTNPGVVWKALDELETILPFLGSAEVV